MRKHMRLGARAAAIAAVTCLAGSGLIGGGTVLADGTETLGPPSIPIADGSDIVAAGVGLTDAQPANLEITVPAGASVEQAILYWEGQDRTNTNNATDTINVAGNVVTGDRIGGTTRFFRNAYSTTYRADITSLGVVTDGFNSIPIGGLDFTRVNNGAGLLVVFDDGSDAEVQIRDGNDLAFINFQPPLDTTVAQTFTFAPDVVDRDATFAGFFSSVSGPASGGGSIRPSIIRIDVGGTIIEQADLLDSNDGNEWDTDLVKFTVPAGVTSVTVQVLSEDSDGDGQDPLAASFAWNAAGLSLTQIPPPTTTVPPTTSTTTTTTTTTVPPTTSTTTTVPPTTTTVPPTTSTTTTVPPTTSTTTEPPVTTTPITTVPPTTTTTTTTVPPTTSTTTTTTTTSTTTTTVVGVLPIEPTTTVAPPPTGELPATGGGESQGRVAMGALVLLVVGLAIVGLARRPQH